ncbi:MAG: DUF2541 domain-containing protein [Hyphomicrobiaceae bacterium]
MAFLAMAAAGVVATAEAQQGNDNWVLLSTKDVDLRAGSDTIDVSKARGDYRAVRIRNTGDDIVISKARIVYGDNTFHVEDRTINLLSGERSRAIDSRATGKFVDTVAITYGANAKGGASTIQVWGLQGNPRATRTAATATPAAPQSTKPADPVQPIKTAPATGAPTAAAPGSPVALAGGDVLFGTQSVGFGVDRDVIRVGAEVGKFDKIRLRVLDNDIFLNELKVIYSNGEPDTLAVNADIKQSQRTNWLNLKGDRFIKEIQLSYRARPNFKGQAHVEVFGQYAEGWLAPTGEGRKFNQGWVLLGAQTADFFKIGSGKAGFDRDIISVGRNEGGFKKIRVQVKDRAITLNELRVVYVSGQEDIIPVKTKVEAGSTYGPIDLKGGTRAIKEISAFYRSRIFDKNATGRGKAVVEVWGQH